MSTASVVTDIMGLHVLVVAHYTLMVNVHMDMMATNAKLVDFF